MSVEHSFEAKLLKNKVKIGFKTSARDREIELERGEREREREREICFQNRTRF